MYDSMYFKAAGVRWDLLVTCPQEADFQALAHFFCVRCSQIQKKQS